MNNKEQGVVGIAMALIALVVLIAIAALIFYSAGSLNFMQKKSPVEEKMQANQEAIMESEKPISSDDSTATIESELNSTSVGELDVEFTTLDEDASSL